MQLTDLKLPRDKKKEIVLKNTIVLEKEKLKVKKINQLNESIEIFLLLPGSAIVLWSYKYSHTKKNLTPLREKKDAHQSRKTSFDVRFPDIKPKI